MRRHLQIILAGVLLTAPIRGRADDRDAALAVVGRAVRAHGGEEALAKARYLHRLGKGALFLFGQQHPFTVDTTMQLPDRLRDSLEIDAGGQKTRMLLVLSGDRAWQSLNGTATEMDKDKFAELREELFVQAVTTLLPLRDRLLNLSPLPDKNLAGKAAAAVKVSGVNRPELILYFDKQSDLLVKIERTAKQAGLTLKKEYVLSDHKDFEGVKLPTRWLELTNGMKSVDLTFSSYDFPSRLDEKAFAKP